MKVYISGAVTGTIDYIERFAVAEECLAAKGYEPINPARVNSALPRSTTYRQYMDMSLVMLSMCDAVYMLRGWEQSKGAREEFAEAVKTGKKIYFEEAHK